MYENIKRRELFYYINLKQNQLKLVKYFSKDTRKTRTNKQQ